MRIGQLKMKCILCVEEYVISNDVTNRLILFNLVDDHDHHPDLTLETSPTLEPNLDLVQFEPI